ncbi:hypothetical protein, partial [Tritonibacter sp. SIMBA_163]|uniref:hypothetical protein n=1 Tax=Tritonibacter sp. SIMBA_163 TaxID=3080868 RepID=UPI00397FAC06
MGFHKVNNNNIPIIYSPILKKYHRFMYFSKVRKTMIDIENKINLNSNINVVHAHTLFSDGGAAYLIKKKYGI